MKTPYDVLGVAPDADEKTIASAFREAAKACHPDLNPEDRAAEQQFKQITAARDALKSPEWRALYQHLQFRRRHERRHWIITVASCTLSALVSAGLVSLFQKQSISEPLPEERLPLLAANLQSGGEAQRFELAGTAAIPARTSEGGAAPTAQSLPTDAEPRKEGDETRDRRQVLAALGMAAVPAAPTAEALAEKTPERAHPAPKGNADNTCHRTGQRAAGSHPTSERCAESPIRSQSNGRPKAQPPRTASIVSQSSKRPNRTLLSLLGRAAGSVSPRARPKQVPTPTVPAAQTSRPTYAQSNECWINESGVRWIPCGGGGGE